MEVKVGRRQAEDAYEMVTYEAIVNGVIVGYASVTVSDEGAYLERIDVEDGHRGQGYGTAFIRHLSAEYGSIVAAPDNADSQRLFERLGDDVSEEHWMINQGYGVYVI